MPSPRALNELEFVERCQARDFKDLKGAGAFFSGSVGGSKPCLIGAEHFGGRFF